MSLYVRNEEVGELAEQLRKALGVKTKTEAVRTALLAQLESVKNRKSLMERLGPVLARADALGPGDPDFDMKAHTDDMWDED